jgi:predicted alpha/beta superfamily hydrolase
MAPGTTRWLAPIAAIALLMATACGHPAASLPAVATPNVAVAAKGYTGTIKNHPDVASRHLSRKRDVWVYLPPGYDQAKATTRYPVLYMHDGNNVFDGKQAFGGHEWGADETAEQLIKAGELPPVIIVGVGNTPDRTAEYTWVKGTYQGQTLGGQGEAYARFLVSELKPMIDRTYRTKPDRANTGVMGSSLGGLMSLYLASHEGDVFGKFGVMSPSVWWADRAALDEAARVPTTAKIWLDMGHREGSDAAEGLENARELKRRLVKRGLVEGKNLGYFEDEMGGHNEQAWAYRLPKAMTFLFGTSTRKKTKR